MLDVTSRNPNSLLLVISKAPDDFTYASASSVVRYFRFCRLRGYVAGRRYAYSTYPIVARFGVVGGDVLGENRGGGTTQQQVINQALPAATMDQREGHLWKKEREGRREGWKL